MISIGVVLLEAAACLGVGAFALRSLGVMAELRPDECIAWSFALGFGLLGWTMFFVGIAGGFTPVVLLTLLIVFTGGIALLQWPAISRPRPSGAIEWALAIALLTVMVVSFIQGIAPPADADSLAYHFALPRQFLNAGRIEFVPRAIDGAIPLLVQMTYVPVLALGGELALTLWTVLTTWALGLLTYSVLRRFIEPTPSLAAALTLMTTPAIVYGGGTGQVEVRIALFALLAGIASGIGLRSDRWQFMALAGASAGFFAGSKYLGLIFVACAGLAAILRGRRVLNGAVFGIAAAVAGFQWYLWNWINSGDPIYPFLLARFDAIDPSSPWAQGYYSWFKGGFFGPELAVTANLPWLIWYPIQATISGYPVFESGRTGLGVIIALLAPFALAAAWLRRRELISSTLAPLAIIAVLFYAGWFLSESSQRIRHLVPIYPLLLICVAVASFGAARRWNISPPVAGAFIIALTIQLAGLAIFSINYARYLFVDADREAFLARNVGGSNAAAWINRTLSPSDKVYTLERNLVYLIDIPVHYGHVHDDPVVDLRPTVPPEAVIGQLVAQGITHFLARAHGAGLSIFDRPDCFRHIRDFEMRNIASRTLGQFRSTEVLSLFQVVPTCLARSNP